MNLADVTIEQLRAATKAQILTAISNKLSSLTKLQLCRLILRVGDVDIDTILTVPDREDGKDGPNGQIWRLRILRDIMGNKLSSQRFEWTYYPVGAVDEITTIQLDAADVEVSRRVDKHFTDGRPPISTG